mmetsp:Transcript_41209/g.116598  ORF Transcript_41209/g.116598 Transcript_41209/m.116598 type:complete len:835 (+) Transcript_41209:94-2598(+)
MPRFIARVASAAVLAAAVNAVEVETVIDKGGQKLMVQIAHMDSNAFRVRVLAPGATALESPMIAAKVGGTATEKTVNHNDAAYKGVESSAGFVGVDPTGRILLNDKNGEQLATSDLLLDHKAPESTQHDKVDGAGAGSGTCTCPDGQRYAVGDLTENCAHGEASLACNGGVPSACTHGQVSEGDSMGVTCAGAGQVILKSKPGAKLYGKGSGPSDSADFTSSYEQPLLRNGRVHSPYYFSTAGYAAFGIGHVGTESGPVMKESYKTDGEKVTWTYEGDAFTLYLIPEADMSEATRLYYELVGRPAVPPRYMFGFGASRWGWKDFDYIQEVLRNFRDKDMPIDYITVDTEGFSKTFDIFFNSKGQTGFSDFGYNADVFSDPKAQLTALEKDYNVKVSGTRRPRIGSKETLDELRAKGWLLQRGVDAYDNDASQHGAGRYLDLSKAEVRDWYAKQMEHFSQDGIDFWVNVEGEVQYYTYWNWNVAEAAALQAAAPKQRFFSLNRGFVPGMARLGAAATMGDDKPTWKDFQAVPGTMLNWVMAGAPYVACNIGGFWGKTTGELLTRWMQAGVFMPLMRVHSIEHETPHWPWNFGAEAEEAMRAALHLRYRLLPYHYSLAQQAYHTGYKGWIRPMAMELDEEEAKAEGNLTTQWFDGQILVAPVFEQGGAHRTYLPKGRWFSLAVLEQAKAVITLPGGRAFNRKSVPLGTIPAYVRAGTVIPMSPSGVSHVGELPNGAVVVQVYTGKDGQFTLWEDDGETTEYQSGKVRKSTFTWHESAAKLCVKIEGTLTAAAQKHAFTQFRAKVFHFADGATDIHRTEAVDLEDGKCIEMGWHATQ